MTQGEKALTVCSLFGLGLGILCYVVGRSNEADYEVWVSEFEKELGYPVPEDDKTYVLPHLYADHWSVPSAVRKYKKLVEDSDIQL